MRIQIRKDIFIEILFHLLISTFLKQGVVERARDVSVWKAFAQEASGAAEYSELGTLLVRIHAVSTPAVSSCIFSCCLIVFCLNVSVVASMHHGVSK